MAGPENAAAAARSQTSRWPDWLDPRRWRYAVPGGRDYRLDFLRGFLVLAMIVNHIGGDSLFTRFTGNNLFLTSAAEGFVFVSGLLMGIVYGGRMVKQGICSGMEGVLRRVGKLHLTVATLTIGFVGIFQLTDWPLWYDRAFGLGAASAQEAVVGALTLHYSFNGTDVLVIYVQMILAAPFVLYLVNSGRTWLVMAGTWMLWAVFQWYPNQAEFLWTVQNSIFPFTTWQALFNTGIVLGYHRRHWPRLAKYTGSPTALALAVLAMPLLWRLSDAHTTSTLWSLGWGWLDEGSFAKLFDKSALGLGRLFAFAVVAILASQIVTRLWVPLVRLFGWLLLPLGSKALVAYGAHLFIIGPCQVWFAPYLWGASYSVAAATLIHIVALAPILLLVLAWPALMHAVDAVTAPATRLLPQPNPISGETKSGM
ncbi:MAG: OpgC domain-containing protein [Chloroflexota bacterium]